MLFVVRYQSYILKTTGKLHLAILNNQNLSKCERRKMHLTVFNVTFKKIPKSRWRFQIYADIVYLGWTRLSTNVNHACHVTNILLKRVRWDCMALSFIYANILFVSFIFNGYFWSLIFPSTREILVITSVTWYVNEYCLICLTFLFTYPLLYLAPHIRFIFIHWRTGSKHINQIHYNWVFKNHSKCAKNLKNTHPS